MNRQTITVITAFLLSRVLCGLFVYTGHMHRDYLSPVPGGWEGVNHWWLNPWTTYDSEWFINISSFGYQEYTTPFFPLYPLLIKTGGEAYTGMALAGVLISNACFLFALFAIYSVTKQDFNEETATAAVWLLAFFPTSAFFSAVYTESLFLLLFVLTIYFARQKSWLWAGVFGLLAALTRNPGIIITAALGMEYLECIRRKQCRPGLAGITGVCLPVTGFLTVQSYFWLRFGNPLTGITSQEFYYRAVSWPWEAVIKDLINLINLNSLELVTVINVSAVVLVIIFTVRYRTVLRPPYVVLMVGVILMHLSYARTIPPYTIGAARYMSAIYPFSQLLALEVIRAHRFLKLLSITVYLFIFAIFSYYFGLKVFLG